MKAFRTVLHGTCLLGGKHPPGSKLARECPVLRRARRQAARMAREGGGDRHEAGRPADPGALGQRGPGQPSAGAGGTVPTPAPSRWQRWQAQQIERLGLAAWRQQERDRRRARRRRLEDGRGIEEAGRL